jgi:zinc protease
VNAPIVHRDPSLPLVQFSVALRTGSDQDPVGKEGLTRILARLMRRTARGLDAGTLDETLDGLGSSLGADVACSTAGFAGSVLTRSLDEYVDLLEGVVCEPALLEGEFLRLKRETHAELLETLDNDRALVRKWFRRSLFAGHAYGRSAHGSPSSVEQLRLDDVRKLYAATFRPDNLLMGASGDIDELSCQRIQERLKDGLKSDLRDSTQEVHVPGPPQQKAGRRLLIVDKPQRTQTQVLIGGLGSHPRDPDHTALLVANTVFGGTFTSRLTHEVRSERGWSYGAYSSLPYDRQRQAFSMWTFPAASDVAACIELQLNLLERWVEHGVTADELDAAKQYLIRSNVFSHDTAQKRMGSALDELLYNLPPQYYAEYPQRVAQVTLQDANRAVQDRISVKDLQIVVVGTEREIGGPIRKVLSELAEDRVVSFDSD